MLPGSLPVQQLLGLARSLETKPGRGTSAQLDAVVLPLLRVEKTQLNCDKLERAWKGLLSLSSPLGFLTIDPSL